MNLSLSTDKRILLEGVCGVFFWWVFWRVGIHEVNNKLIINLGLCLTLIVAFMTIRDWVKNKENRTTLNTIVSMMNVLVLLYPLLVVAFLVAVLVNGLPIE